MHRSVQACTKSVTLSLLGCSPIAGKRRWSTPGVKARASLPPFLPQPVATATKVGEQARLSGQEARVGMKRLFMAAQRPSVSMGAWPGGLWSDQPLNKLIYQEAKQLGVVGLRGQPGVFKLATLTLCHLCQSRNFCDPCSLSWCLSILVAKVNRTEISCPCQPSPSLFASALHTLLPGPLYTPPRPPPSHPHPFPPGTLAYIVPGLYSHWMT